MKYIILPLLRLLLIIWRILKLVFFLLLWLMFLLGVTMIQLLWHCNSENLIIHGFKFKDLYKLKDIDEWLEGRDRERYASITDYILDHPKR